eukprot:TRINITY_DN6943_c0_g1_i2.p1 TRINITY_DN6943_c0_g1~~TRINITY_DN6943_c0_g1_i2.p1  ORF type:complete len:994 (-),score=194.29 TRINITY_DN6943_c0_g1_i2:248-3229(-)
MEEDAASGTLLVGDAVTDADERVPSDQRQGFGLIGSTMFGAIIGAMLCAVVFHFGPRTGNDHMNVDGLVMEVDTDPGHKEATVSNQDRLRCSVAKTESFDWEQMSSADQRIQKIVPKALQLLEAERTQCSDDMERKLPSLPLSAEDFLQGSGKPHSVHAHFKFASKCQGETFKLHFFVEKVPKDPKDAEHAGFVVQIFKNYATGALQLLKSNPQACLIKMGTAASPEYHSTTTDFAKRYAKFAATELSYQLHKNNCIGKKDELEMSKLKSFRTQVGAGLTASLVMTFNLHKEGQKAPERKAAELLVLERCDGKGVSECYRQLLIPDKVYLVNLGICAVLKEPTDDNMRLLLEEEEGTMPGGHFNPDATELWLDQQELLLPPKGRRLGETPHRDPLVLRHIKQGTVPSSLDPRSNECFTGIPLYDQGVCGSCYANAVAVMFGIRQCLYDKGNTPPKGNSGYRRLDEANLLEKTDKKLSIQDASGKEVHETNTHEEADRILLEATKTRRGCKCKYKTWRYKGKKLNKYCAAPGGGAKTWCFTAKGCKYRWDYCTPQDDEAAGPVKPTCADSTSWKDLSRDGCSWYAKNDKGCKKYKDYGQKSHCQKTCDTCPIATDQSKKSGNRWLGAHYNYMPSVQELAPCAQSSDGTPQGCDGGNTWGVWNRYLQKTPAKYTWRMGASCLPYKLKCWTTQPGSVVNPLVNSASCAAFADYQMFHKPCSCIPQTEKPSKMECSSTRPSAACRAPLAPAMFLVANIGDGLSNKEAVLNMQRHVNEYGPIYSSFATTTGFKRQKWQRNPVYTGGGKQVGGHAVVIAGWGAHRGIDYWLIRNSWGPDWAEGGYCKFKRGVNLDNIESSETAASMPYGASYADWSAPVCTLKRWAWSWSTRRKGRVLTRFEVTLKFTCSKDAKVRIFTSKRLKDRDAIRKGVSGRYSNTNAKKHVETSVVVEAKSLDFGVTPGDMWVQIVGTDSDGNNAKTSNFVPLPRAGKVTSASR